MAKKSKRSEPILKSVARTLGHAAGKLVSIAHIGDAAEAEEETRKNRKQRAKVRGLRKSGSGKAGGGRKSSARASVPRPRRSKLARKRTKRTV